MIASLPMYLRAETRGALDTFWMFTAQSLRDRGIPAPDALDHTAPVTQTWASPDLTLGQICNLPYRTDFHDHVTLIAAVDFGLPDAAPGHYYSHIITRADDPRDSLTALNGATFALNGVDSQSGWGAAWMLFRDDGITPGAYLGTGAHRLSAQAVADGRADFASIDAQTYALMLRHDPALTDRLRIVARTPHSPAITFITAGQTDHDTDPGPYRAALQDALTALPASTRDILMLHAIVPLPTTAYTDLPIPPRPIEASQA
jgi:ABC-type phosphate/phosphonate transport system substrate-binding protein